VFAEPPSPRLNLLTAIVFLVSFFYSVTAAGASTLFDGADPDVLIAENQFWIFPTNVGKYAGKFLFSYSSDDLKRWTRHGPILRLKDVLWVSLDGVTRHSLWAPGIIKRRGKYYLYFSVGRQNPTPSRIGVAVASTPDGVFVDSGKPLITGGGPFEAIDPMVFSDTRSGHTYLYCGGSAGCQLHVYELNDDLLTISKQIMVDTPYNFTEGAFMHVRNGIYYLSYSHGCWRDDSYCVCYSTAPGPTGPWTYKGKILTTDRQHFGPGHHAFLKDQSTGKCYIVYHRWNGRSASKKRPEVRSIAIDSLEYKKNGDIFPVRMTD